MYTIDHVTHRLGSPIATPYWRVTGPRTFACHAYADAAFLCHALNNMTRGQVIAALGAVEKEAA